MSDQIRRFRVQTPEPMTPRLTAMGPIGAHTGDKQPAPAEIQRLAECRLKPGPERPIQTIDTMIHGWRQKTSRYGRKSNWSPNNKAERAMRQRVPVLTGSDSHTSKQFGKTFDVPLDQMRPPAKESPLFHSRVDSAGGHQTKLCLYGTPAERLVAHPFHCHCHVGTG